MPPTSNQFSMHLDGRLPLYGADFHIAMPPARLNKKDFPRTKNQLAEGLRAMLKVRPADPVLSLHKDGECLRSVKLLESPDREGYMVSEVKPGEGAGTVEKWIVHCAVEFSPRKVNIDA